MLIEIEQQDQICVLRCKGRSGSGADMDYLEAKLEDIRRLNCRKVLADFSEVPSIGSLGLTFLVGVCNFVMGTSGGLVCGGFVLTGAGPLVRQALHVTRLSEVIRMAANPALGLDALRETP